MFANNDPATSLDDFLRRALMKSLKSENGHLDLFVRFLHGLSLESNQRILGGLLDQRNSHPETIQKVLNNLKEENSDKISPDRSINIFHCLMEMKDQSVHQEIQEFLKSGEISERNCQRSTVQLWPTCCRCQEVLDELNLQQYNTSDEGRRRLIPAVRNCRKFELSGLQFIRDQLWLSGLGAEVQSLPSEGSGLSENQLKDPGVKLLCGFLQDPLCKLETLSQSEMIQYFPRSLKSNRSHLRVLDLSYTTLQDSGVKRALFWTGESKLLFDGSLSGISCGSLASGAEVQSLPSQRLDLSWTQLKDPGVKLLCGFLQDPNCRLETLRLRDCRISEISCGSLASALRSNPTQSSHLRELDLGGTAAGSGVKLLSDLVRIHTTLWAGDIEYFRCRSQSTPRSSLLHHSLTTGENICGNICRLLPP
ncbi:Ribonuclease inhibitor [Takifugu flavidus]|uniref:Ribonuclease inhibitor n=1 Tax=Takifugu flavidus TaxID=433684 RepID=A0A5C6MFD0_9TELE|nr:Ribonuclease inhibitor [Takifugu flavidus]